MLLLLIIRVEGAFLFTPLTGTHDVSPACCRYYSSRNIGVSTSRFLLKTAFTVLEGLFISRPQSHLYRHAFASFIAKSVRRRRQHLLHVDFLPVAISHNWSASRRIRPSALATSITRRCRPPISCVDAAFSGWQKRHRISRAAASLTE